MLIVSDVHAAFAALRRVASSGRPLLVLGDLVNFVDYRTGAGLVADLFGKEFVTMVARHRAQGDYEASRRLWREKAASARFDVREAVTAELRRQYEALTGALAGAEAYVTYGNVDHPALLAAALPAGCRFVDGEVVEVAGWRVGFAGGGAATPLETPGEVSDEDMVAKLEQIGPVDVLCSHLPPAVDALTHDVVTGRTQRASRPILDYLMRYRPPYHYFGDIHQPRATRWRVGATTCVNAGYFRATGRPVEHPARPAGDS